MRGVLASFVSGALAAVVLLPGAAAPDRPPAAAPAAGGGHPCGSPAICPDARTDVSIDDAAMGRKLTRRLTDLMTQRKATKMSTLIEQLKRTRHRLALPAPPQVSLHPAELYRRCRTRVLVVGALYKCSKCPRWHTSTAGGFAVADGGVIATNHHVVDNPDRSALGVMTFDGKVYPVEQVLAADKDSDVAILKVPGVTLKPLALRPDVPVGTEAYVIGHPAHQFYTLTEGIVSRRFFGAVGGRRVAGMSITADYARGSSGGPVLDASGAAIGMVDSTRSIHAKGKAGAPRDLQMVIRNCVPARAILKCLGR